MKMIKMIGTLALVMIVLTSCSSKEKAAAVTAAHKPSLEMSSEVSGHTAIIRFKTDLIISSEHYGKERIEEKDTYICRLMMVRSKSLPRIRQC